MGILRCESVFASLLMTFIVTDSQSTRRVCFQLWDGVTGLVYLSVEEGKQTITAWENVYTCDMICRNILYGATRGCWTQAWRTTCKAPNYFLLATLYPAPVAIHSECHPHIENYSRTRIWWSCHERG